MQSKAADCDHVKLVVITNTPHQSLLSMPVLDNCWGHCEREKRKNKINKLLTSSQQSVDTSTRVLIKKGPSVSEETSLSELEEIYARTAAWKKIEDGGVHGVPIEELRMAKPPKPDQKSGQFGFQKANVGKGTKIEDYAVVQTIKDLNDQILDKYNKEKGKVKAGNPGMSEAEIERRAAAKAYQLPEFSAVSGWQDVEAEIKVKRSLEDLMSSRKIPAVVIRSVNLKAISALTNLGLGLPGGDGEIDVVLAFVSGDVLHLVICEVKRADTYPWRKDSVPPNKQAVNKAEKQLIKERRP